MSKELGVNTELVAIACHARDDKKMAAELLKQQMEQDMAEAKAIYKKRLNVYKAMLRDITKIQAAITPQAEAQMTQDQMQEHEMHLTLQDSKKVSNGSINSWEDDQERLDII